MICDIFLKNVINLNSLAEVWTAALSVAARELTQNYFGSKLAAIHKQVVAAARDRLKCD